MSATVDRLREIYDNRHALARQWQREGRQLCGYLYSYVPEELIHAAGMLPIQLTDSEDRETNLMAKEYLEDFYCDFACACLGQGLAGKYDYLSGMVFPDACESVRSMASVWKMHVDIPFFHWLKTCYRDTPGAKVFFAGEMADLKAALERFTGRPITDEALRASIRVYNENRALVRELYRLRDQSAPPIALRELFDVVTAGLVMPKEEHNRLLCQLIEEVKTKVGQPRVGPRLLLTSFIFEETISAQADIVAMIEGLGGDIVANDLTSGVRYLWQPVDESLDPMFALTERYRGAVPGAFRHTSKLRSEELTAIVKEQRVAGMISVIPRYCTPYLWEYPFVKNRLDEQGVPAMMLESVASMTDGPVRTRVEAFIEMLGA